MNNQTQQSNIVLNQQDLQVLEQLLNTFPLGSCNVSQGIAAGNHAQQILNFLVSKAVAPAESDGKGKKE